MKLTRWLIVYCATACAAWLAQWCRDVFERYRDE